MANNNTSSIPLQKAPESTSYMWALMQAVSKDQQTLEMQQITDAKSTEIDVKVEGDLYAYWYAKLTQYANGVSTAASSGDSNKIAAAQADYNWASASAQSNESQQDGAIQSAQGQTSSDASNLQMKAQMLQGVNSILTTLTGLLGRITA